MALYKYTTHVKQVIASSAYDELHKPNSLPPNPGIYRCEGCGRETTHSLDGRLPPPSHHPHSYWEGPIQWRLLVIAQADPPS